MQNNCVNYEYFLFKFLNACEEAQKRGKHTFFFLRGTTSDEQAVSEGNVKLALSVT